MNDAPGRELALRLSGLEHAYPIRLGLARKTVLSGIDLELARGESLGLIGPNGSGKSTLLRLIAGVEEPRAGALEVLGGRPSSAAVRGRIGFLPEESPYPPELSARSMLALAAALHRMPRELARTRSAALLARVGLTEHARTPLARFSRGMLRRFGLAAALLSDPDLVLLDEPTAGLDAPGFLVLEELLAQARARGATVVVASHHLTDIQAHCERLLVLVEGRAVLQGTPRDLERPLGAVALELEGLDEAGVQAVAARVDELGGRLIDRRAAARNLIELYRRFASGSGRR